MNNGLHNYRFDPVANPTFREMTCDAYADQISFVPPPLAPPLQRSLGWNVESGSAVFRRSLSARLEVQDHEPRETMNQAGP